MKEAALVVLGWFLGLMSVPITEALQRRADRQDIKRGVLIETSGLAYRMAHLSYAIEDWLGRWDRELLNKLKVTLEKYEGVSGKSSLLKRVTELLNSDDEELALVNAAKSLDPKDRRLAVKEFHAPFLDAHIAHLRLLDGSAQRRLLELMTQLALFNAHVADARELLRMTFDSGISGSSRQAVETNLQQTYRNIGDRAKLIIDEISRIEELLKPST